MSPKRSPQGTIWQSQPRGFALVVTLSLSVVLVMMAVGLLSLSGISLRTSTRSEAMAAARANAKLALLLAIGDLQKHAGPDTRVTAPADLVKVASPNPHWAGVWKTRTGENLAKGEAGVYPVGHHESALYLTDLRAKSGPDAARAWLVSSPEPGKASPDAAPASDWITLLTGHDPRSSVRVPRLPVAGSGTCAWWVSDENQKARVDLTDPHEKGEKALSLAVSHKQDFAGFQVSGASGSALDGLKDARDEDLSRIASVATVGVLPSSDAQTVREHLGEMGHHLTADSAGLFTDVMRSGLKRDLSAFLAVGDIPEDPATGQPGLRETDPMLPGAHHAKTGPRFGALKGWADLAERIGNSPGDPSLAPQGPNARFMNLTNSAPGRVRDLTNVSKPAIQPIVVEASLGWDFSPYSTGAGSDFLRCHIYPRLTLWNPFNVKLDAVRYLVLLRHPQYGSFTARGEQVNSRSGRLYFADMCGTPESAFLGFVTEPTALLPGETKIFTPSVSASQGAKLHGKAAAFNPLNYAANVLTAEQIPGVENFHFDTTVPLPAETTANRNAAYGFSGNTNSFYATAGRSDEFIVTQAGTDPRAPVRWTDVTRDTDLYPRVAHFLCQNWGLNRYDKWYGAEANTHPSNNGTPFREFAPGAAGIGPIENRRPPRLWRRGVRIAWFDDEAEYTACGRKVPRARFTQPWLASANLRGGCFYHPNWVNIPFAPGWQFPAFDSHLYFQQPTDPQKLASFFPPSPIADPGGGFPSTCTLYDVPRLETGILSLGQLQHAQLSYCTWHPSLVLGHSQPTMYADLDATAIKSRVDDPTLWKGKGEKPWDYDTIIQKGTSGGHDNEMLLYDLSFEANEALWDRYMVSGIPYEGSGAGKKPVWQTDRPLPVSRHVFNTLTAGESAAAVAGRFGGDPALPFFRSAEVLLNQGAFNVNSTSVEAWKALFATFRGKERESVDGSLSTGDHPLSRSLVPGMAGAPVISQPRDPAAWSGFRSLTDQEIQTLAEKTVEEVRKRGPFLSVADFINRRLTTKAELSSGGTLDTAIRLSRTLNRGLERTGLTDLKEVGDVPTAANRPATISQGIPGFFTQGDLLTSLAPVLTARGDTFRIRAYGEADAADGSVARAWCEAIVQRCPDYIDPADDPVIPAIEGDGEDARPGPLSHVSLVFGRRFLVTSFRWIPASEIKS